jgi:hypothetical protein
MYQQIGELLVQNAPQAHFEPAFPFLLTGQWWCTTILALLIFPGRDFSNDT